MGQYTSYYLYEKYERRCSGSSSGDCSDWIPSYPNVFSKDGDGSMPLVVRIENDYDCGYTCPVEYDWRELPIDQVYQCDECETPVNVTHKWEDNGGFVCEGTTKYQALQLYSNSGNGWEATVPTIIKPGNVIEEKSLDCGYQPPRFRGTLSDGSVKEVGLITSGLIQTGSFDEESMIDYGVPPSQVASAEFYHQYVIKNSIFAGCQTLTSLTLDSRDNVESCAFFGSGLKEISGYFHYMGAMNGAGQDFQFANCKSLTSVTVTNATLHTAFNSFGTFANCTSLTQIDVSKLYGTYTSSYDGGGGHNMEGMFLGCSNLKTAKVAPDISSSRFERCTSLESVDIYCGYIDDDIKIARLDFEVGDRAFFNCSKLSALTLSYHDASVRSSYEGVGLGKVVSGDPYINHIGEFAFFNCESLPVSEIEDKLGLESAWSNEGKEYATGTTSYAAGAFVNCKSFTHIPIPQWYSVAIDDPSTWPASTNKYIPVTECPVTSVGRYAFSGCTGLQGGLEFDEYLDSIGAHAFDGCTGITSVTIANETPPTLGEGAFDNTSNCPIYVPCDSIEDYLNSSHIWNSYKSRIYGIPPCEQPEYHIKAIATYSSGSTRTLYCDGVSTDLSTNMFDNPQNEYMTEIEIGECVTDIARNGFFNSTGLTTVNIPSGVTSIGDYAFYGCSRLTSVKVNAVTPPFLGYSSGWGSIWTEAFDQTNNCPIYVPDESLSAYKSHMVWSKLSSRLFPMSEA